MFITVQRLLLRKLIRKLQVELLGSTKLYEIVDKNLRECKSHPLFVKEELKLYEWRNNFFRRHFPYETWTNGYHEVGDNDDDVQIF